MGLVIGLGGGGNAGGGGGVVAGGLIQDMAGVKFTGSAEITDKTITEFSGADCRYCTDFTRTFYSLKELISVTGLKNTQNVVTTAEMFIGCKKLAYIEPFDTSNVTNMNNMFTSCCIEEFPQIDTSNVTDMSYMFRDCVNLLRVQIDTRNATDLTSMFDGCERIEDIILSSTDHVKKTYRMFAFCKSLIEAPYVNTSLVKDMSYMFYYCSSLLTVPILNTSAVTNMYDMFYYCSSLQTVPAFDTSSVTYMSYMFYYCSSLKSIGGTLDMIKVTSDSNANYMFENCKLLETVKISNLGVSLDLSYCQVLSVDSVLYLFNNAKSGVSGKTIKLNSLVFDQLTEDQIAIATQKGFSVSSVVRS